MSDHIIIIKKNFTDVVNRAWPLSHCRGVVNKVRPS